MYAPYIGAWNMALYCLATALAAVWVMFAFTQVSGAALTFVTFALAWAVFFGIHWARGNDPTRLLREHWRATLVLNMLTLISWWFMFMALQRIEASVESAIYQGWMPLVVVLCEWCSGRASVRRLRWLGAVLILLTLGALVGVRLALGATERVSSERLYQGIALASIAGITGGIYVFLSGRLNSNGRYSAMDILSARFYLLLLVTGWIGRDTLLNLATFDTALLGKLCALALVSVLIPVFCLQYAVQRMGSARVSILTPCVPVIALVAECVLQAWQSIWVPLLVIAVCVAVVLSNLWLSRTQLANPTLSAA